MPESFRESPPRVSSAHDCDEHEHKMTRRHETNKRNNLALAHSNSLILFVIPTCVLLLFSLRQAVTSQRTSAISTSGSLARVNRTLHRKVNSTPSGIEIEQPNSSDRGRFYPTHYDIVKLPESEGFREVSLRTLRSSPRSQTSDHAPAVAAAAAAANLNSTNWSYKTKGRRKQRAKLVRPTNLEGGGVSGEERSKKNATLEEEIETVNALIEVLDAANKKLAEQKRRQKLKREHREEEERVGNDFGKDFSVTRASMNQASNSTSSGLAPVARALVDERAHLAPGVQEQPSASEQVRIETTRDGNRPAGRLLASQAATRGSAIKAIKTREFKAKKSARGRAAPYNSTLAYSLASNNQTNQVKESNKIREEHKIADMTTSDHNRVRPGFDEPKTTSREEREDNTPMSQNYVGHYQPHPMLTLDPMGGILPSVSADQMQEAHGPHLLLQGHRPIVAQDLLSTSPRQAPTEYQGQAHQEQQQHQNDVPEDGHPPGAGGFVRADRHRTPMGLMAGPLYESHSQAGHPTAAGHQQLQALQMLKRQQMLGYGPYPGLHQDPYGYSTTERAHDQPIVINEEQREQGATQGLGPDDWTPLVGSGLSKSKPYRGEPAEGDVQGQQPLEQPNYELNNRFGEMNHGVGQNQLGAGGLPLAGMSPLQHLLDAAKNQQTAYERGRLHYELELRKREEAMRRQHEANLERQRVAANQRAAAEAGQQQRQQLNESGGQSGEGGSSQQEQERLQQNDEAGGNGESGNEQQQDDNNQQGQANEDSANDRQQQQQSQDDPDMKNFQNFAGDTDFTDLFPPGILSEAEIKEMRKQQEEQKQRQDQEEQEEQEKQQAEGEAGEEGEQQQQQQQQQLPGGESANQQQQPSSGSNGEQPTQERPSQNEIENSDQSEQQQQQRASNGTLKGGPIVQGRANSTSTEVIAQQHTRSQQHSAADAQGSSQVARPTSIASLPSYLFQNVSSGGAPSRLGTNQTGAPKTRRSRDNPPSPLLMPQPLLVFDSEYQARYMKPFLSSLMTVNEQQLAGGDKVAPPPPSAASGRQANHGGDDKIEQHHRQAMPLVDFDDLLESYGESQRA